MQLKNLDTAIVEAERFLTRAKALRAEHVNETVLSSHGGHPYIGNYPKEQGSVKRASMDLSRALADLRRCN